MKKIFFYRLFLMSIVLLQSCSKSSNEILISPQNNTITSSINALVKGNGTYELNLNDPQSVTITKQASHFQTSEAGIDSKTGWMVYKYTPAQNYIGSDEVLLTTSKTVILARTGGCNNGSNHTNTSTVTSNITIKINVGN